MEAEIVRLIEILPEPCFMVSAEGVILAANRAAGKLCGSAPAAELEQRRLDSLLEGPREHAAEFLARAARNRQLVPGSLRFKRTGAAGEAQGTQGAQGAQDFDAQTMRCDAARWSEPGAGAAVIFLRCRERAESGSQFLLLNHQIAALSKEVLERKKAERQRDELFQSERTARQQAELNSRLKDEFVATLSHELRTPLNAILGWSQLLRRFHEGEGDLSEGLQVIERNARVQVQMVEDLLDMSRIISGKLRLEVQRLDLAAVVRAAVDAVLPAARAKDIRLQTILDEHIGPVRGDASRLQQVVWNLLTNAVKFTPKGGRVQVALERVNSHAEISVSDTGAGIEPEFLPYVFDRFRQGDASATRGHGGLGLGLALVKHIVEAHGGVSRAKSPGLNQGSTFSIEVPVMVVHERTEPYEHPRLPAHDVDESYEICEREMLRGITVLMVDDDADSREVVRRVLEDCHARVLLAETVAEAFATLKAERPDVLLSDIGMPVEDGYSLIRKVRGLGREEGGATAAAALTAFARSDDRRRSLLAGFQAHIAKPVEPAELITIVASLAGRLNQPQEAEAGQG